jgi:hypothetical protein
MASIITATTTSGLTQSADNSGVLQLASGVGNLVTIPAVTGTAMVSGAMPAFSAFQGTLQLVTGGVATKIQFQTEEFDTNSNFDNATNYRFTPTVAGYYQINTCVQFAGNTTTISAIYKNGSPYKYGNLSSGLNPLGVVASIVFFNGSTDYVEIYAIPGATSNTGNGQAVTWFNGCLMRAA